MTVRTLPLCNLSFCAACNCLVEASAQIAKMCHVYTSYPDPHSCALHLRVKIQNYKAELIRQLSQEYKFDKGLLCNKDYLADKLVLCLRPFPNLPLDSPDDCSPYIARYIHQHCHNIMHLDAQYSFNTAGHRA